MHIFTKHSFFLTCGLCKLGVSSESVIDVLLGLSYFEEETTKFVVARLHANNFYIKHLVRMYFS